MNGLEAGIEILIVRKTSAKQLIIWKISKIEY